MIENSYHYIEGPLHATSMASHFFYLKINNVLSQKLERLMILSEFRI